MYIKSNDTVEVITGNGKGTRGKVLAINRDDGKITVEGINRVYKHVRRSQKNPQGGRLNKEMPISISNVLLFCPKCAKGVRVGARVAKDGSKERFCKKCEGALGQIAPAKTKKTATKKTETTKA